MCVASMSRRRHRCYVCAAQHPCERLQVGGRQSVVATARDSGQHAAVDAGQQRRGLDNHHDTVLRDRRRVIVRAGHRDSVVRPEPDDVTAAALAVCDAVKSTVPQEMWGEIIEKLDEAEQHPAALDVGTDFFDDDDDAPFDPTEFIEEDDEF